MAARLNFASLIPPGLLADLGGDVVKIEKPARGTTREASRRLACREPALTYQLGRHASGERK